MDSNSKSQNIIDFLGMQENEDVINSSAKGQEICEDVTMEEMKDRISDLPDEILCHILTFLPTKYAVGTCILSTRWKYLWTSSFPINLDFDDELLLHRKRKMTSSFTSFVHRVLTLGNMSCIQRFYLKCGRNYECSHVNAWICAALLCNIQELDLCTSMYDSRVLPRDLLFTCGTLVSLKLDAGLILCVPSSIGLPKLKTLLLKKVIFRDDDSVQRLFSGCPVLEELVILECGYEKISVLNISGLSILKRLIIFHHIYKGVYKVIIDAPTLEYLELTPSMLKEGSSVKNVESLIEAYLDIYFCKDRKYCFELIRAVSNVKVLHLYGREMHVFLSNHQELPMFPNITRLEVGVEISGQLLPYLLQNSPNLEALFFHRGFDPLATEKFHWSPPKKVPYCLLHCLKTIKICEFHGLKEELKLVKYFLKNSNVLHLLKINTTGTIDFKDNKKLLMFPRRSKSCEVVLC